MAVIFGAQIVLFLGIIYLGFKREKENVYADKLLVIAEEYTTKY